jgi:heat-inducible transcriptional repressor
MHERHERVLQLVAEHHVHTARPVASALVAAQLEVSSATVRNLFADLEAMGLLQQPHASAGRIPTTDGFAHYARQLLPTPPLPEAELAALRARFASSHGDQLVQQLAEVAAQLTGYAVVVTLPVADHLHALEVHLSAIGERALLAVVVLENGSVRQVQLDLNPNPDDGVIDDAERQLRALTMPLHAVPEALATLARHADPELARTLLALRAAWPTLLPARSASAGLSTVLHEPEAHDPHFVRQLIACLEHPDAVVATSADEQLEVAFEASMARLSARWRSGAAAGQLTLLGPARLRYRPALQVIDALSRAVRHDG